MVEYNGRTVKDEWPHLVEESQQVTFYVLDGKMIARIKYDGDEPCHDCAVLKGQYHVPGCDVERCPSCQGQYITCQCPWDDEEST